MLGLGRLSSRRLVPPGGRAHGGGRGGARGFVLVRAEVEGPAAVGRAKSVVQGIGYHLAGYAAVAAAVEAGRVVEDELLRGGRGGGLRVRHLGLAAGSA